MHIPDGYLSPQTFAPAYAVMLPLWSLASRRLKKTLRTRQAPMLALGAAFSFVVMMFNVPAFGTSGHAVGAVLIAILLGPWAALVAVSLALAVQALIFGDGGVTTLAANCLNMAVIMPFTGWGVYRLIAGSAPASSRRHSIGAAIGGYIGLNAAALATAVMFGIQPLIAHDSAGRALYMAYGLNVAIPAMMAPHILVFGFIEAVVTGMVVAYLQKTDPGNILAKNPASNPRPGASLAQRLTIGLIALILLSPLGLIIPAKLGAGTAWGEWSNTEMRKLAGYVPEEHKKISSLWHAPLPDYDRPANAPSPLRSSCAWYVISGAVGAAAVSLAGLGLRRWITRKGSNEQDS